MAYKDKRAPRAIGVRVETFAKLNKLRELARKRIGIPRLSWDVYLTLLCSKGEGMASP